MKSAKSFAPSSKIATAVMLALSLGAAGTATASTEAEAEYKGALKDAWLDGRVETAFTLNRHLNPFTIDTRVKNGVAYLDGHVESDIDRDLAGEIAMSIDGVTKVENNLRVRSEEPSALDKVAKTTKSTTRGLLDTVDDATITAGVKTRLIANGNVKAMDINVDTDGKVVTLSGKVRSEEERQLAEQLALNVDSVAQVRNELKISAQ